MTPQSNHSQPTMNTAALPEENLVDVRSELVTDVPLVPVIRTQHVFPYLLAKEQLTVVSMDAVDPGARFAAAALASVLAIKAATSGTLPMFGKGVTSIVNLLVGKIDKDRDADVHAFQQTLLDEENALRDLSQWAGKLRIREQGKDGARRLYLNTVMGFSTFVRELQPDSLTIIYDLDAWLRSDLLTAETGSELLAKFQRVCSAKGATLVIFERHSSESNSLAAAVGPAAEVLRLVAEKKGPALTGYGSLLRRERKSIYDTAPEACLFWVSLNDAGGLTWGMEPSEGPQLVTRELDAVQRRILTARWAAGDCTSRQLAELLGKNPADYPDKLDQQGLAKMLDVSPTTTCRDLKVIKKKFEPRDA